MKTIQRALATAELLLIFPAALFMTALFVRNLQPEQFQPARTAIRIVNWYAASTRLGLWVLLMALPLTVLAIGCVALIRGWRANAALRQASWETLAAVRAHGSILLIAVATAMAGGILAIVALHVLTD
ncbi:MAG TPA: hypothetical protein VG225_09190 [Terracidiphilus sp.]|jgi:sterol desaturase/sphingolipid hydroxylase (fatty acid hydroxylase superfamily)|nr:hypothetical protein [Terracidiphilus sp.]